MSIAPGITIRHFIDADTHPVEALLHSLWGHDPTMLAVYQVHRVWHAPAGIVRQSLIATQNELIGGVGTVFESTLHPTRFFLVVNVARAWQRQGIGTALYNALTALGDGRPWLVKATRRDAAGLAFLSRRGYHPLVETRLGVLDPSTIAVQQWMATLPHDVPGYTIRPLDEASAQAQLIVLAHVHATVYRQFHQWNPPVVETDERALAHYCGSTVFPDSHLCVYQSETLIGAANLFRDPSRPTAPEGYLVHLGVVTRGNGDDVHLTAALIRRCLEWAARRGLRIRFEVDTTYVPHRAVFEQPPATEVDDDFIVLGTG